MAVEKVGPNQFKFFGTSVSTDELPEEPAMVVMSEQPRLSDLVEPPPDWVRKEPEHAAVLEGARELRRQLIAAQEERDEAWSEADIAARRVSVIRKITHMSVDEFRVVELLTRKLMGEGRDEYGPLDLSRDSRTAATFRGESRDELGDALTYALFAELKEG